MSSTNAHTINYGMPRLETRHWALILIALIVAVAMITDTPLSSITEILYGIAAAFGLDFGIKRIKEAKGKS